MAVSATETKKYKYSEHLYNVYYDSYVLGFM